MPVPDLDVPALEARIAANRAPGASPSASVAAWRAGWPAITTLSLDDAGLPHFVGFSGLGLDQADAFVAGLAAVAGVAPADLVREGTSTGPSQEVRQWTRRYEGAVVEGDSVRLIVKAGRVEAAWVHLSRLHADGGPVPGEVLLPSAHGQASWATRLRERDALVWRGRDGQALARQATGLDGSLAMTDEPYAPGDALVSQPAAGMTVTDSAGATSIVADDGTCPLDGPYDEIGRAHV